MSNDSLLSIQLDEYKLERLLGQGGMARVYRGIDTKLQRYVAIVRIVSALCAIVHCGSGQSASILLSIDLPCHCKRPTAQPGFYPCQTFSRCLLHPPDNPVQ